MARWLRLPLVRRLVSNAASRPTDSCTELYRVAQHRKVFKEQLAVTARRGGGALSFGTVCGIVGKRVDALRRKLLPHKRAPVAQVDRAAAF